MQESPKIKLRHRLLTKLLISHIFVATITIIFGGWFLLKSVQHSIQETIVKQNIELARRAAQLISATLSQAQTIIQLTAQNPAIYEGNRIIQELTINNLVNQFHIFNRVAILDTNGFTVINTSFLTEVQTKSRKQELSAAFKGQSYLSEVYLESNRQPAIDLVEPIRIHNEIIGLLLAQVNLRALWELMERSVIGKKGEAFILDKSGYFVAHSDRKQIYLKNRFQERAIIQDIQQGIKNQKIYFNQTNEEILAAYTPLFVPDTTEANELSLDKDKYSTVKLRQAHPENQTNGQNFSFNQMSHAKILIQLGWGLIIQQPTSEAFAAAKQLQYKIVLIGIGSILLAILLALINAKLIELPVRKLISGIERYANGQLDYEIESLGQDEIGKLSERFNWMTKSLLEFQRKLKRNEHLELLNRMSSVLAHEIRNPLNSMVINMQIIRRELHRPGSNLEKMEKYFSIINLEIKRLDQLVQNFLLVSRPPKLKREKVFINEILDGIILSQQVNALEKGVRVERRFDAKTVQAYIDEAKVKQVFLNIYLNAIQAMAGGGKLTITLATAEEWNHQQAKPGQKYARIQFIDTGKGIEPEVLKHIFDFYFSTKESGTGLGLSIAQQIVEEHGGFILVSSDIQIGSCFEIYLPLK